ncbi:Putative uncharacterized protein [Moritella viscosa]|nr:Putative uncharacterized protein [Moritella viscosa]
MKYNREIKETYCYKTKIAISHLVKGLIAYIALILVID